MPKYRPILSLPAGLLFLALLLTLPARSQVLPPIWNFRPSDYGADTQNWAVDQTDRGWIYFANNGGLLEFNGVSWNRYYAPNGSALRSVHTVGNRVYTGCYMEFGYWEQDAVGRQAYTSLSASLADTLLPDARFNAIYFSSTNCSDYSKIPTDYFRGKKMLTISDCDEFISSGGIIELFLIGSRVRFSINKTVADKEGLMISSRLLKLAEVIE